MTLSRIGSAAVLASLLCGVSAAAQGPTGFIPTPNNPPTRAATRGANFLHIDVGATVNGMSGAAASQVSGPLAWFLNPAGASTSDAFSAVAGRQSLYGDFGVSEDYAAASLPLLGGVVGVGLVAFNSGDIDRTSEAAPLGDAAQGRTFQYTGTAISLGYARRLTDRLSVGGQAKYITEGITDASVSWVGFDVGTQFRTGIYGTVIGGALQHVGGGAAVSGPLIEQTINSVYVGNQTTRANLDTRQMDLPTSFRFALGDELYGSPEALLGRGSGEHRLRGEFDLSDGVDISTQYMFGAEYSFRNMLFLRAGKHFYNDDRAAGASFKGAYGLSGGFGFRVPFASRELRLDYSYTSLGDLQNTQVFSFELGR